MKRFLISMVALLAVVGCAKQEDLVSADLGRVDAPEFTVGFESSRVFVSEAGRDFKLSWTQGDLLSCFLNTGGQAKYEFTGETGAESGIIKAVSYPAGTLLDSFYAIYPYNEGNALNDGVLSFTLPAEQAYAEGTFGPNSNTMVAVNADGESYYTFSNVCGYIRLMVYGNVAITSITFEGNNDEVIAGAATYNTATSELAISGEGKAITLSCGEGVALKTTSPTEFWVVVPPTSFDEGISVTLTDAAGKQMTKVLDTPFAVERNKVHNGEVDYVSADQDVIFDAQFDLDGTASDAGMFGLIVERKTDGSGQTPNMSTYYDEKIQRNMVEFTHIPQDGLISTDSYYFVDFTEKPEFENAIKDGFTFEILTYRIPVTYGNWAYPFSLGAEHVDNNGWGLFYNSAGTSWNGVWQVSSAGGWSGPSNFPIPAYEQYEHVIISCDADGNNKAYTNGEFVWEGVRPINLLDGYKHFAIGGLHINNEGITRQFQGKLAMIRIYDNLMTAEQAKARFESFDLPVNYDIYFDAQFTDNTVSDAGSYNLPITVVGEPTIENGVLTLNNPEGATNQYVVADLSAQWSTLHEKIEKLGLTYETVVARTSATHDGAPFAFGSNGDNWNTFRLNAFAGGEHRYAPWSWQEVWMTDNAALHNAVSEFDKFYHVVLKCDALYEGNTFFSIYINGEFAGRQSQGARWGLAIGADVGFIPVIGIGALPVGSGYEDINNPQFGFDGKVAVARLYDRCVPDYVIKARYNELKPTIDALNAQ